MSLPHGTMQDKKEEEEEEESGDEINFIRISLPLALLPKAARASKLPQPLSKKVFYNSQYLTHLIHQVYATIS